MTHISASEIHINDEFKALIPPLLPDEYAQLEANILTEGCRDALVLWDDVLIDGHNRYSICQKHGLPFRTEQATTIQSYDDAVLWIVNNQLGRRNINDFVRGELALRAKPIIEARAKDRRLSALKQGDSPVSQKSDERGMRTDDAVADRAGVSRDTIRKIEKIHEDASPEILAAVRSGDISINAAAQVAKLPADQQSTIASGGIANIRRMVGKPRTGYAADLTRSALAVADKNDKLREELAEARDNAALLADELTAYRAVESGEHLFEIQQLQEVNRILTSQLNDYTNQVQQLKQQVKRLRRSAGDQHVG